MFNYHGPFADVYYSLFEEYETLYAKSPEKFVEWKDIKTMTISEILDPSYGYIEVPDYVVYLFGLPIVQRMANLKQLSFTYLTLSGANHTRLEHSIGVFHLATKVFTSIRERLDDFSSENFEDLKVLLGCVALLHDIGHPSFGHSLDGLSGKLREIIRSGDRAGLITTGPKKLDTLLGQYIITQNEQMSEALKQVTRSKIKNPKIAEFFKEAVAQIVL